MRKTMTMVLAGATLLVATPVLAQATAPTTAAPMTTEGLSEADLQILRSELRADKRKVTAETLKLTDAEAAKFWPVYDKYVAELAVINNDKYAVIKEYTEKYGTYNDAQATAVIKRYLSVDVAADKLRLKYVPIVGKVLPGVKAASFFQIDRRLAMLVNLGLASQLPILQTQSE